jgi:hypothetical protein
VLQDIAPIRVGNVTHDAAKASVAACGELFASQHRSCYCQMNDMALVVLVNHHCGVDGHREDCSLDGLN